MAMLSLSVVRETGETVYSTEREDEATLSWRGAYEPGDKLVIHCDEVPAHLVLKLDAALAESHVLMERDTFEFPIPLGEGQKAYGKGWAFEDERHYAYARIEDAREAGAWRCLSRNSCDYEGARGVYPHATSNIPMDNPQFIARNAIDGVIETSSHGSWPHESWGVAGRADAWLKIDFGEEVVADELRLYLRADFPHDTCWESAKLELSDGSMLDLSLEKAGERQTFDLGGRRISWVKIGQLVKRDEDGFPGLSQIEVWGRRGETAQNGASDDRFSGVAPQEGAEA